MRHIFSVLVENRSGVLARVSGLFSSRGFNIDSLCVGETNDPNISRMTIVVKGDDKVLEQVRKQLNKLIDVIKVQDFEDEPYIDRELVLLKVNSTAKTRPEIVEIANIFRAKVVSISPKAITIEVTGVQSKIDAIIDMLKVYGIIELVRTGRVAISRV